MHDKLKVLFLAADPFRNGARLELEEEARAIEHAIRRGSSRDGVELVPRFAMRTRDLQDELLLHKPQIVHFAGHGNEPGVIHLGDEHGLPQAVGKEALGKLFGLLPSVRVVVLNACDTLSTIELLCQRVDHAIGMNRPVQDTSAITFARFFYGALAMGRSVAASFELAVVQLELEGNRDAPIPVMRSRQGADPNAVLVTRPASDGPAPGDVPPEGPVQVTEIGHVHGDEVDFLNRPGAPGGGPGPTQIITAAQVTGRRVTFGNG